MAGHDVSWRDLDEFEVEHTEYAAQMGKVLSAQRLDKVARAKLARQEEELAAKEAAMAARFASQEREAAAHQAADIARAKARLKAEEARKREERLDESAATCEQMLSCAYEADDRGLVTEARSKMVDLFILRARRAEAEEQREKRAARKAEEKGQLRHEEAHHLRQQHPPRRRVHRLRLLDGGGGGQHTHRDRVRQDALDGRGRGDRR